MPLFFMQTLYLYLLVCAAPFLCLIHRMASKKMNMIISDFTQKQKLLSMTGFSESIGTIAIVAVKVLNFLHMIASFLCA